MGFFKERQIDPSLTPERYAHRYDQLETTMPAPCVSTETGLAKQESSPMTAPSVAHPIHPTLVTLAGAMRLQFSDDAAAVRAIDRAVDHLAAGIAYEFDGVELRVTSWSRRGSGTIQVTDGIGCTCESSRRAWCWHRAGARLLMAEMALSQPGLLRAKIIEQVSPLDLEPAGDGYDDYGDFLAQPFHPMAAREVTPAAGSTWERSQATADALFA